MTDVVVWPRAALSAACLLAATNGPAIALSIHVLHRPFLFEDWPFWLPIHVVIAVGIVRLTLAVRDGRWPRPRWTAAVVAAFPAWMLIANLLADAPIASTQRGLVTAGICVFAVAFALDPLAEQISAVFMATHAATLTSAALIVVRPNLGRSAVEGQQEFFQGIFANRNSLGPVCALGMISAVALARRFPSLPVRIAAGALGLVDLWLLVGSRSATPVLGLLAAIGSVAAALVWRRWHRRAPALVWSGFAAAVVAVFALRSVLLGALDRSSGFSDRTSVWADVARLANDHPIVGRGFWAFWDSDEAWNLYVQYGGFQFGSAHNSLLEVALGSGWVGAACFLAIVISAAARAVVLVPRSIERALWWLPVTAFVLVEHATESFVHYYSYLLILLVTAAAIDITPATDDPDGPADPVEAAPAAHAAS